MKNSFKSLPIFLAFLCMGFGDVVGPLTSQLQSDYHLSNTAAGLVTFMGFIMFGLLPVPMALFQDKKGKKYVLLLGLIAAFLGLILPIIGNYSSFILLLGALLLLGTGATMLQVAGNPIMRDVSPEGKYSRNLSFGQFVKAIASLSGALIPLIAIKFNRDWRLLFPVYSIILAITIIYLFTVKIEEKKNAGASPASLSSCFGLLSNKYIAFMVLGIFLYVGAEVCMSAKLPNFLEHKFNFDIKQMGLFGTLFFFLALMAGRFLGGVVLNWLQPKKFLVITSLLSIVGITGLFIVPSEFFGFVSIAIIGLGFANIFPLIFSITVDAFPERTNEISGLMITAIIGGALIPILFGAVADAVSLMTGFIVPLVCIIYILLISFQKPN
jgi:MFS transporter, FHS family, L-fucose permease